MCRSVLRILVLEKSGYSADENFFDSSVPEISDVKKAVTSISDDFFSQKKMTWKFRLSCKIRNSKKI